MKNHLGAVADNRRTAKSDSAFRTISEAAKELGLQQHVLRFWESKFPQIKPMKRAGGRRYYRPEDLVLLADIRSLLHDQGYTIKGVQKLLDQHKGKLPSEIAVASLTETADLASDQIQPPVAVSGNVTASDKIALTNLLGELEDLQGILKSALGQAEKNT
ncbi:MerR family transcriptional regulator [Thalassospira xianhensis]|jgi:DNA-binding transcriptional MerR regulator|uniref:MerR family transcriptional regulator n=1 Tax=Thalassospira TaxID=168934 RepID=UPI000C363486|nr:MULTISPECIES: MerR family transcriptional regulator [Thalassospira]MAZ34573.1 MerR family transcriptional regulator [Thalassospira sp.]MBO9508753.1 MerR family transcriptional regulator [Thalassospira sp. A3_1]